MLDLRDAQARYELVRMAPARRGRSSFRAYLEGPYPWPQLVPDPEAAAVEGAALRASAGGGAVVLPSGPVTVPGGR